MLRTIVITATLLASAVPALADDLTELQEMGRVNDAKGVGDRLAIRAYVESNCTQYLIDLKPEQKAKDEAFRDSADAMTRAVIDLQGASMLAALYQGLEDAGAEVSCKEHVALNGTSTKWSIK